MEELRISNGTHDFVSHMHDEYDELCDRRRKLQAFIATNKFKSLDSVDQYLLMHQNTAMGDYISILKMRIDRAEG